MKSKSTMKGTARNRGQLVLITGIVIAFIVLGLVVVFNGLLYSQTVASGDAKEGMDDVEKTELELVQGIQGVVTYADEVKNCQGKGDPANCFTTEVSAYTDAYSESKSNERAVRIEISNKVISFDGSGNPDEVTLEYTYKSKSVDATREVTIDVSG